MTINKKQVFYLLIIILFGIAIIPRFNQLIEGVSDIKKADGQWVIIAALSLLGTYLASALIYMVLAKPRIDYFRTVLVQVATSFTNRLLPGGIGGIGLNVHYLIKSKQKASGAASVTSVAYLSALVSHFLLIVLALIISQKSFESLIQKDVIPYWSIIAVAAVLLMILLTFVYSTKIRRKTIKIVKETVAKIWDYRRQPQKLLFAVLSATAVTCFYVLALYACSQAMGLDVSFVQVFIVYTLGVLTGAASMTPGGVGGMEAGVAAGLIAYGEPASLAFSAVIIYRLVTFWLPILPGYIVFYSLRRAKII